MVHHRGVCTSIWCPRQSTQLLVRDAVMPPATAPALTCSCRCITQGVLQGAASCSKSSTYRHSHVILEAGRRRNRASCPWAGRRARSVEVLHSRNHSVRTTPATTTPARPCHACTQASTVLVLTVAVPVCCSALPDARIPKALQGSSVRAIEHAMHRQRVNATSRARTAPASHSHGYVCAVYVGWWCGCLCSCMLHGSTRALLAAPAPYPCHRFARGPQQRVVAKAPPVVPLAW